MSLGGCEKPGKRVGDRKRTVGGQGSRSEPESGL